MQKLVASPSYPRRLPTPTKPPHSDTYVLRVRVPAEAKGGTFKNTHTQRSLKTRDLAEAHRRIAGVYDGLLAEFDAEAAKLAAKASATTVQAVSVAAIDSATSEPVVPLLSIADVVQRYREHILQGVQRGRRRIALAVKAAIAVVNSKHRKKSWRMLRAHVRRDTPILQAIVARLQRKLDATRTEAMLHNYVPALAFLNQLEVEGIGRVADRTAAARELTLVKVRTLKEMLADDEEMTGGKPSIEPTTVANEKNTAPLLSVFVADYIAKRGASPDHASDLSKTRLAVAQGAEIA